MKEWLECWRWLVNSTRCFYNVIFFFNCHRCGRKLRQAPFFFLTGYKHLWCHQASSLHLGFRMAVHLVRFLRMAPQGNCSCPSRSSSFHTRGSNLQPASCSQEQWPVVRTPHQEEHRRPVILVLEVLPKKCTGMLTEL